VDYYEELPTEILCDGEGVGQGIFEVGLLQNFEVLTGE
jgi:hypothetical protein